MDKNKFIDEVLKAIADMDYHKYSKDRSCGNDTCHMIGAIECKSDIEDEIIKFKDKR